MSYVWLPAQLYRLRKEWKSVAVWIMFPMALTIIVMKSIGIWQEETTVPIALVVDDETYMARQLVEAIENNDFLHVQHMKKDEALHKLGTHELDSVFIIRKGYEENVLSSRRNRLIEAYSSNQSYAYPAIVETITSLAQQDVARSKASYVIKQLLVKEGKAEQWDYNEIINSSKDRQRNEALLQTNFSYYNKEIAGNTSIIPIFQVWGVWSLFAMISTFFLFDWVLKENRPSIRTRWYFTAVSYKVHALRMFGIYTGLLITVDMLTVVIFSLLLNEPITMSAILALIIFRLTINVLVFLIASFVNQLFFYYIYGNIIALFLNILGGAIIPIDGLLRHGPWVGSLSPVSSLMVGSSSFGWLIALTIGLLSWIWKGGKQFA